MEKTMNNKAKLSFKSVVVATLLTAASVASALPVYVINTGVSSHGQVINAVNNLNALGNTVTTGGTLADYSAFD